jgi:hypothetical protein
MTPCLCKKSIVIHDAMCYNIITVKEGNKPKTKKQNLYLSQISLPLKLKSGKSKMKRVDNRTTKNLVDFCKVIRQLVIEIDL